MPPSYARSKVITDELTEMPRCCSIFIQSDRARRAAPRAFTSPAARIAPPNSSSFSVSVVLPASGCEMMAKVRRSGRPVGRMLMALPLARPRRESYAAAQVRPFPRYSDCPSSASITAPVIMRDASAARNSMMSSSPSASIRRRR